MSLVLDNSVCMHWCFGDGNPRDLAYAETVMDALQSTAARVPSIWSLEVANVLVRAELQKLITITHSTAFLAALRRLPIQPDVSDMGRVFTETLTLARRHGLSAYDAAYLELALREQLPLATLDARLRKACGRAGVVVFE